MESVTSQLATSSSYISSWDPNEPRYIQHFRLDVQPTRVECPFREKSSGMVVVVADNHIMKLMAIRNM